MATKTKNKDFELDPEWIYQDPIDFEHKKYKLLAYLQKCDKRFDELKIYPDFVELSLHLANLQSISKEKTMLTTKKKFKSCDDEILFKELIPKKIPKLDDAEQLEIDKTVRYSGEKIYEAFNIAKSIWTIAQDAISVQIKKNKDRLEDGMGYIYFRRRSDEKLLVWEYEIKKEADYELSTKAYLKLIFSGSSDEKTFTDIIEEKSTWNHTEYFKDIPVFEVKSSQEFPFEETFIPMMKRQLMSYVFQVVNYKKMRNLED
jgi:hypothetical protein